MDESRISQYKSSDSGFAVVDVGLTGVNVRWQPVLQWYIGMTFVVFVSLAALIWLYKYARIWYALHHLPGPQDWFPPGYLLMEYAQKAANTHYTDFSYEFSNAIRSLAKTYDSEGLFRIYLGLQPSVVVYRAEFAEKILSDPQNIGKHSSYRFLYPWLGLSLLTSTGNEWRQRRKLLTPAFHFKTLDNYVPTINARCAEFVDYLNALPQKEDIRLFYEISKLTLDCVGDTTMGFKMESLKRKSTYSYALAMFQYLVIARTLRPWVWPNWIYEMLDEGRAARRCCEVLHHWSRTIIRARRDYLVNLSENTKEIGKYDPNARATPLLLNDVDEDDVQSKLPKTGTSFLDTLLAMHLRDPKLTLEHIREEVDTVLFAGQDTTATTVAFTLYLLGLHKESEQRVLDEIDDVFGDDFTRDITQEDLRKLKYLDACAKEAMRLFPPIPIIGRRLETDMKMGDYVIPRGVELITLVSQLHRDPEYFPDPERFCPDRFFGGRRPDSPFAYIPFSAGPRNCIGQKVALLEMKIILAHFLRHYRVEPSWPIHKLKICFEVVTRAKGGLRVRLVPRRPQ